MKKILLFLLLGTVFYSYGQEIQPLPTLFEFVGTPSAKSLKNAKGGKMKNMMSNPMYKEIRKVKFHDINIMARRGEMDKECPAHFEISIPNGKGTKSIKNILVIPTHIEVKDNGDYEYHAELVKGKNNKGYLTLIHEGNKNYGSMSLNNRSFQITNDDSEGDMLIELSQKELKKKTVCRSGERKESSNKTSSLSSKSSAIKSAALSARSANGNCNVRVLVLFTAAADRISNPQQLATTLLANTNNAARNSRVNSTQLTFQLAGVRRTGFREGANPRRSLTDAVNNAEINRFRDEANADLVAVLTDGLGGGTLGIATLDEYQDADEGFVTLVEADASNLVFGHEVGHLMGARHENDTRDIANLSPTAKGHTWYKRNCFFCQKLYRKSIVAAGPTRGLQTPFFSNPAVKAEPKARGNTGTNERNNYAQLLRAAPIVANYDPFQELTASISGPFSLRVGQRYTMTANVRNCPGTSYRWERSENGFNYFRVGTGRSYSGTALPVSGNRLYFRLRVTCTDGQTRTVSRSVFIEGGPGGPIRLQAEIGDEEVEPIALNGEPFVVYPNPASDQIVLASDFEENQNVTVTIFGISPVGYEKKLFKGKISENQGQLSLDVSNVPQGLYQIVVTADGKELAGKRLLISR